MKSHKLFVMCGVPGAGKSTWLAKQDNAYVISRDAIRFAMVKEDEEYFSKETQVFKQYIKEIQQAINSDNTPENIYCDATHINSKARNKLLKALDLTNVEQIIVVVVRPSLEETIRRNAQRSGRAKVPVAAIRRMWNSFERPEYDEDKIFDTLYVEVPE